MYRLLWMQYTLYQRCFMNRLLPKLPNARENVTLGGQGIAFLELGSIFACLIPISEEV